MYVHIAPLLPELSFRNFLQTLLRSLQVEDSWSDDRRLCELQQGLHDWGSNPSPIMSTTLQKATSLRLSSFTTHVLTIVLVLVLMIKSHHNQVCTKLSFWRNNNWNFHRLSKFYPTSRQSVALPNDFHSTWYKSRQFYQHSLNQPITLPTPASCTVHCINTVTPKQLIAINWTTHCHTIIIYLVRSRL